MLLHHTLLPVTVIIGLVLSSVSQSPLALATDDEIISTATLQRRPTSSTNNIFSSSDYLRIINGELVSSFCVLYDYVYIAASICNFICSIYISNINLYLYFTRCIQNFFRRPRLDIHTSRRFSITTCTSVAEVLSVQILSLQQRTVWYPKFNSTLHSDGMI